MLVDSRLALSIGIEEDGAVAGLMLMPCIGDVNAGSLPLLANGCGD